MLTNVSKKQCHKSTQGVQVANTFYEKFVLSEIKHASNQAQSTKSIYYQLNSSTIIDHQPLVNHERETNSVI